jgi:hypothetical protein
LATDGADRRAEITETMCAVPNDVAIPMVNAMAAFDSVAVLRECDVPVFVIGSAVPTNGSTFLLATTRARDVDTVFFVAKRREFEWVLFGVLRRQGGEMGGVAVRRFGVGAIAIAVLIVVCAAPAAAKTSAAKGPCYGITTKDINALLPVAKPHLRIEPVTALPDGFPDECLIESDAQNEEGTNDFGYAFGFTVYPKQTAADAYDGPRAPTAVPLAGLPTGWVGYLNPPDEQTPGARGVTAFARSPSQRIVETDTFTNSADTQHELTDADKASIDTKLMAVVIKKARLKGH